MNPDLTFILQNIAATLITEWNGKVCPFRAPVETLPPREGDTDLLIISYLFQYLSYNQPVYVLFYKQTKTSSERLSSSFSHK